MFRSIALTAFAYLAIVRGQQAGTSQTETHPRLSVQQCTAGGSCTTQQRSIVLDSNWRWTHIVGGYTNCYTGNEWNTTACPDGATCAKNCALEGADYPGTYGITASGSEVSLKFVTEHQYGKNIGSRVYLLESDTKYQMFNLLNQEFTFDVDMSQLPCGLNGAVYFVQMDADGGMAKNPNNKAGAKFGTGYCDTQCPHDIKFISGEANVADWKPSPNDTNAGTGKYGACCNEMDIWEANSISAAYTPHVCNVHGLVRCDDAVECGDGNANRYKGICDKDGCDFSSFRLGDKEFLGPGKKVDTTKKITVVTQFITSNNQTSGDLVEIRRVYVQNGAVIQNSKVNLPGMEPWDSITDQFCVTKKQVFNDQNSFTPLGGMKQMGEAFKRGGMVLVMSLWDDHAANMLWLDSNYPLDRDPSQPGVARGTCPTSSGKPEEVEAQSPGATVKYSNIKWGPIGSTFSGTTATTTGGGTGTTTAGGALQTRYGQCGGQNWTGTTQCAAGLTCVAIAPPYYSHCQ